MTEKLSFAFMTMEGLAKQRQERCTVERRKQGWCSGIDMTFTFLPKREKEDVRFRDEQISESHRAVEVNASAVERRGMLSVFAQNAL